MTASDHQVSGWFEGDYEGVPVPEMKGVALPKHHARRYALKVLRGTLKEAPAPVREHVENVRLEQKNVATVYVQSPEQDEHGEPVWYAYEVLDAVLSEWDIAAHAEIEGRALGRIRGRLTGRVLAPLPKKPEPPKTDGAPRGRKIHDPPKPIGIARILPIFRERSVYLAWVAALLVIFGPLAAITRGTGGLFALISAVCGAVLVWREARFWKHLSPLIALATAASLFWTLVGLAALSLQQGRLTGFAYGAAFAFVCGALAAMLLIAIRNGAIVFGTLLLVAAAAFFLEGPQLDAPAGLPMPTRSPSSSVSPRYLTLEEAVQFPDRLEQSCTRRIYLPAATLFEAGEASVKPSADKPLAALAALLRSDSTPVFIAAHVDTPAADASDVELSRRRAEAARAWLVEHGDMAAGRFDVRGEGSDDPLVVLGSERARLPNQRLEIGFECR